MGVLGSILDISWFAITDFQSKVFQGPSNNNILNLLIMYLVSNVNNIINLGATEYWQAQASKENALQAGLS